MKESLLLFFCVGIFLFAGAQSFKIDNNQIVPDKPVLFKAGTAEILKESEETILGIKNFLDQKTYISLLRVEGHVAEGNNKQRLSEERATAVLNWLVKNGVDCKRLIAVGFGDSKPIAAADSPEKAGNNRIVFAIAALKGRPLGGMPVDGGGKLAVPACQ